MNASIDTGMRIPVFINNRNRVTTLKLQLQWLETHADQFKIIILDNDSSFPALLTFYKTLSKDIDLVKLNRNIGPFAAWVGGYVDQYKNNEGYYVVTDSDVVADPSCPPDFIETFKMIINSNAQLNKVGFSLDIFNIPDEQPEKWRIITSQLGAWSNNIGHNCFLTNIDTTFALYKKGLSIPYFYNVKSQDIDAFHRPEGFLRGVRTGYPYLAKHLPWDPNCSHIEGEEEYYKTHVAKWGFDNHSRKVFDLNA